MDITHNWTDYLFTFFKANEEKIAKILNASSCRELWIQGELFLYSDQSVKPNSGDFHGLRVDLHGKIADLPEMIAELKIIGYHGYASSDIFGYGGRNDLKKWLGDDNRQYVHPDEHMDTKLIHSLYKDYKKLQSIHSKKAKTGNAEPYLGEKLLVLVIPNLLSSAASRGPKLDEHMQIALREVEFDAESTSDSADFDGGSFTVRIWRV